MGEENAGLHAMFTMMNNANWELGSKDCHSVTSHTKSFRICKNAKQGNAKIDSERIILDHPDVRRMIIMMKSLTGAVGLYVLMPHSLDLSKSNDKQVATKENRRASFLIPIAKAFSTEIGCRVADIGIQVHGGMGYVEETGVARVLGRWGHCDL